MRMASSDSGVSCRMPEGFFMSFALWEAETSPCQCHTGMSASSHRSVRRKNWSLISAFVGPM